MNFIKQILISLIEYPKSILILVAILNMVWVFYIVILQKNLKQKIYKAYLFYAFFVLLWVISNAYFQTKLLTTLGVGYAKFFAIIANITVCFSMIGFYYLSCFVKKGKASLISWIIMGALGLETVVFNLIPNFTVKEVKIFEDGTFELVLGKWNDLFFLLGVMVLILGFINFISAIRGNTEKIRNAKLFYMLFGMSLMYGSLIIFLVIFPTFLKNFDYVWIPPLLSMADILIVGYAILTKRFLDIRLLISTLFKITLSLISSSAIAYLLITEIKKFFPNTSLFYLCIFVIIIAVIIYNKIIQFLNSHTFYRFFGRTNTEYFIKAIHDLRKRDRVYNSVEAFERSMQRVLSTKDRKTDCRIITINKDSKLLYPKLTAYFEKNRQLLVTEEVKFIESEKEKMFPFMEELESLGGVCLPLFHPSKGLVGFFTLGEKSYNHLYTKGEIEALENMSSYLSLKLTDILYNAELRKEVAIKTKQLNQKMHERNELVKQQADFMAVTAHEFRTPLSIAIFQLEEILEEQKGETQFTNELHTINTSLDNLKQLTQRLFDVQQHDLDKVTVDKEKTNVKDFMEKIYKDFTHIMQEKSLKFTLKNDIKKGIHFDIDQSQFRQVLHNILTNAYKFTSKGSVTLKAEKNKDGILIKIDDTGRGIPEKLKKNIFNKFRTNSTGDGIGLGLYLCRKIVELHGGNIWVEDSGKEGSSFCIQLPN